MIWPRKNTTVRVTWERPVWELRLQSNLSPLHPSSTWWWWWEGGDASTGRRFACLLVVLFLTECVRWGEGEPEGGAASLLLIGGEEPIAPHQGLVTSSCGRGTTSLKELRARWPEQGVGGGGERHVCELCGASYSVHSSLARHIRTDHSHTRKVYTCTLCGSTFKHNFSRNLHLRTVHKLNIPNCRKGDVPAPSSL